jgi:hypothetical protein
LGVPTRKPADLAGPTRPLGSPDIPQFHLPSTVDRGIYAPRLYGAARIHFGDRRRKLDETTRVAFLLPLEPDTRLVDWDAAVATGVMPEQLLKDGVKSGRYLPLPAGAMELKRFTSWAKTFDRWLARTQKLVLSPKTDAAEEVALGPKRGGVSVELVGIAWELS